MNLENRSTGEFFESAFFSEFTPSLNTHDIRPQVHYCCDEAPDALESPRLMTDSSQSTAISYTYYPYGESSETVTDSDASVNRYRFTGREYETGYMNFYRSRYYNNRMGRFYSKDTWDGAIINPLSLNKYLYVEGNPVNFRDPNDNFRVNFNDTSLIWHIPPQWDNPCNCNSSGPYWPNLNNPAQNHNHHITGIEDIDSIGFYPDRIIGGVDFMWDRDEDICLGFAVRIEYLNMILINHPPGSFYGTTNHIALKKNDSMSVGYQFNICSKSEPFPNNYDWTAPDLRIVGVYWNWCDGQSPTGNQNRTYYLSNTIWENQPSLDAVKCTHQHSSCGLMT